MLTAERRVCSARALIARTEPVPAPAWRPPHQDYTVPGVDKRFDWAHDPRRSSPTIFHRDAVEHRLVAGTYGAPGPGTAWIRLSSPLVDGEETSPLCGLLAAADFGSALSQSMPRDGGASLINVDVSLALVRPPAGEWFLLDATGLVDEAGAGLATARLADVDGPLGVLHLSQVAYTRQV